MAPATSLQPSTAQSVVERFVAAATAGRWDEATALFHDDAVIEHRLALHEGTRESGRDEIAAHLREAEQAPFAFAGSRVVTHLTAAPDVVVAELEYDVEAPDGGRAVLPLVQVFVVVEGRIALVRDYHSEALVAARVGELLEPATAIEDGARV